LTYTGHFENVYDVIQLCNYWVDLYISAKHVPKLEITQCRKNSIHEKPNRDFFAISPVGFAPHTQTYANRTSIAHWLLDGQARFYQFKTSLSV
jgi:hypothetical protein